MSKHTAEVIIIGGGVNGCAAAYYLAKAGMKNVIVLEGSPSIGHGGSSRNGGGVRQSGRDVRELPYAMYAVQNMWPTLSEELGVDVEYYQKGNLRLGKTDAHMEKLRNLAANANSLGLDMKIIDGKEVKEICPYLSDEIIGASWCPTDGHANPMLTTLAYYKRATELGVNFFTDAKVIALEKVKGKLRKVILESGEVFEADKVVLAAGYESRFRHWLRRCSLICLISCLALHQLISTDISHSTDHLYLAQIQDLRRQRTWDLTSSGLHRSPYLPDAGRSWDTYRCWQMPRS